VTGRGYLAEPAQRQSDDQHGGNVRTAAYWLRKAIRARASADMYPEDRDALENIAEMYEQIAQRVAEIDSESKIEARPCVS
jgi:hypothetical protein